MALPMREELAGRGGQYALFRPSALPCNLPSAALLY